MSALQRLAKWRGVLAGWQLGTRPKGDPEADAVRDHRELSLILRAELNALVVKLIEKGVFTQEEFVAQVEAEADHLSTGMSKAFPGFKATDWGIEIDPKVAAETMRGWRQ